MHFYILLHFDAYLTTVMMIIIDDLQVTASNTKGNFHNSSNTITISDMTADFKAMITPALSMNATHQSKAEMYM